MTTADESEPTAREAFSLLGHEIRLEILLALLDGWRAVYTDPRSYADLMDAVGMRDSGKFNYHLDKLRGVYVREVEDGYVPTASVTALYRSVLAHRPTERTEYDPTAIDSDCPRCDAKAVLRYNRGFVSIECSACDDWAGFTYPFPKNGFETRNADAVARATVRRARHHIGMARTGQCPFCAGGTAVDIDLETTAADDQMIEIACDTCTFLVGVEPLQSLLTDNRVAGALADVGVDLERYDWELPTPAMRIKSRDPGRVVLEVDGEMGSATILVDETFSVRSVTTDR
ncbi:winged helix-turn-helix domain-containing protein [Natrinema halophilum]|uniref:Winged helix-turn-helix transcriptional regulator n=1 Tax=Natrinema halophilum TaxID=1699371 RepID=A0A7D5GM27_9EURY|nr:winged helix-turn-helix domain-containing protein [Natrinema halophilum]QLG50410.1 winged helix-turn-helix domain-containing protein [Natrinema halophilum]